MQFRFGLGVAAMLLLVVSCSGVHAKVVPALGSSVFAGDVALARQEAIDNAIHNALITRGVRVDGVSAIDRGLLTEDRIQLASSGQISDVKVLQESRDQGVYRVLIEAEIGQSESCSQAAAQRYNRSLLFTAFPRDRPQSSTVGRLHNVDQAFPRELARRLYPAYNAAAQVDAEIHLSGDNRLIRGVGEMSTRVQAYAQQYGVQFVVGGSIVDMSMLDGEGYSGQNWVARQFSSAGGQLKNWTGKGSSAQERVLAFRMVVYDGLSGQFLYDKTYAETGLWDASFTAQVGFASPGFWRTDYGAMSSRLIDQAVADLGAKISCQPLMIPVSVAAAGTRVILMAGANSGVRNGDHFALVRKVDQPHSQFGGHSVNISNSYSPGLEEADSQLTVTQTFPTYSVAKSSTKLRPAVRYLGVSW